MCGLQSLVPAFRKAICCSSEYRGQYGFVFFFRLGGNLCDEIQFSSAPYVSTKYVVTVIAKDKPSELHETWGYFHEDYLVLSCP